MVSLSRIAVHFHRRVFVPLALALMGLVALSASPSSAADPEGAPALFNYLPQADLTPEIREVLARLGEDPTVVKLDQNLPKLKGTPAVRLVRIDTKAFDAEAMMLNIKPFSKGSIEIKGRRVDTKSRSLPENVTIWTGTPKEGQGYCYYSIRSVTSARNPDVSWVEVEGFCQIGSRVVTIRNIRRDDHAVIEQDLNKLRGLHPPEFANIERESAHKRIPKLPEPNPRECTRLEEPVSIDVLVIYSNQMTKRFPGETPEEKQAVAEAHFRGGHIRQANELLASNGVPIRIKLTRVAHVNYNEREDLVKDKNNLVQSPDGGPLKDAHTLRKEDKADIVLLFVENGGSFAGLAGNIFASRREAVAVIDDDQTPFTTAHEIGHLLGLRHDTDQSQVADDLLKRAFAFANNEFGTIMAERRRGSWSRKEVWSHPPDVGDVMKRNCLNVLKTLTTARIFAEYGDQL